MLDELRLLMNVTAADLVPEDYRQAICDKNVLQKRTDATRRESLRRLREMYGLDPRLRVFRALRDLWNHDAEAQPLLAVLCACTRDPILKSTAKFMIKTQQGDRVDADMISEHVLHDVGDHLNRMTLGNIGRHAASSWTQSGHLRGRTNKIRVQAACRPTAVAYALFLGYLTGDRGDALLGGLWAQILDGPQYRLREQALQASREGWINYRYSGSITDIGFDFLNRG